MRVIGERIQAGKSIELKQTLRRNKCGETYVEPQLQK
jgi:hypothetical protein